MMGTLTQHSLTSSSPPPTTATKTTKSPTSAATTPATICCHAQSSEAISLTCDTATKCSSNFSRQQQQQQQQMQQTVLHKHSIIAAAVFVLLSLLQATAATPVFVDNPSLAQFQSGRNIRHLPCIVRKSGRSGVCMFAIDCIKQNGTHLGTCIDRFYFGSCCQMKEETPFYAQEISDNSIDQNTISHFSHESTTLPTSALYKLTTESQQHLHSSEDALKNKTNNIISASTTTTIHGNIIKLSTASTTRQNTTSTTAQVTSKPFKPTLGSLPPKRTSANTTHHKISQFVVRTTARPKPLIIGKPTIAPTTIKPPKRRTTTAAPMLTTTENVKLVLQQEQRIETTTLPQKFFTFQMVETTTPTPTEPTNLADELQTTQRPRPTSVNLVTKAQPSTATATASTTPATTSTSTSTTTTTTTARTTTTKPIPTLVTRRPASTRRPTPSRRPGSKPTRRPVTTTTLVDTTSTTNATTNAPVRRQPITATADLLDTATKATTEKNTPQTSEAITTTRAPRPKPKPTAEIFKVPRPTVGTAVTTTRPAPTITTTTTEAAAKQPATITQQETRPKPNATAPTRHPTRRPTTTSTLATTTTATTLPTTTQTTTTTARPQTKKTTARPSTSRPITSTSSSSTTTSPIPTLTTEAPKVETHSSTTTHKPGLVTWTNVAGEPLGNTTIDEEWHPRPAPSDWVPVPTIAPETQANKTTTVSTTEAPASSSTQKIIVSITSSVSEMMNNVSVPIKPAPEPESAASSTSTTVTSTVSTTIPSSTSTTTTTPKTTTTTTTTTTTAKPTITTESPAVLESSTSTESTFGTTTTEYLTEDYNATLGTTTTAPINTLEGVDYRQVCGRRMFPEPRIVGGSNAAFGRWPWQISLRQWRTSTYLHKCGAALLNENWAITAAHCVDNVPPSDLLLRLGEYDLAEEEEPYGYQERRVQIVASHPQFDPRTFEYDLALLRFYEPVVFQPNIIPVCVPENDMDFIGQTAFVTGWGRLYEDGPLPSVLQEVAVPVINNTICETMYRAAGYIEHIPHIFICAGWKKGGYDSCEGDSGGPMVLQREEDKRFQLGGVISWGIGCAEANQPGVYTRISEFRDWINQILQF